jgi:cytochrome P450
VTRGDKPCTVPLTAIDRSPAEYVARVSAGAQPLIDFGQAALVGAELHARCAELRQTSPVAPALFYDRKAVVVTRYADVHEALRDDSRLPGGDYYSMAMEPVLGRTFISMNGREHDVHRKLATPAFRSRSVTRFDEEQLAPLTHEIIDGFVATRSADLVAEFASVLPFAAMARTLGVPEQSAGELRQFAAATVDAGEEFATRFGSLLAERRDAESDDVLALLATSELDGEALPDAEILATVRLLLGVGALTVEHALSTLLWAVLTQADVIELARSDPSSRPGIVHELLRWEGPVAMAPRLAREDTEVSGTPIEAGTIVLLSLSAANRDPSAFDQPDVFDPGRRPSDILTFGFGNKFCPGSHLARRELLTALGAIVDRLPGLTLVDPEGSVPHGGVHRHPEALLCAWD